MTRNTLSETSSVVAKAQFTTGNTVNIALYKNGESAATAIDTAVCTEIGATGVFEWAFSNITTAPTAYSDYFWVMDNSSIKVTGSQAFGGWPESVSGVQGSNQVTITIEETDTTPIEDVSVQVYNSAQTLLLDNKTTDALGQVVFALDDGSYKVISSKSQVTFTVPEDLTVSDTTVDTYNGTPIAITPGSGAGECEVSIFTSSQRPSTKLSTVDATATIKELPTLITGVYYSGQKVDANYDTLTGRLYWILPRGSVVFFKVDDMGIGAEKTIPDSASADYSDL